MSAEFAYLLWLLTLIVAFYIAIRYNIRWFSAFVFALLASWLLLTATLPWQPTLDQCCNPTNVDCDDTNAFVGWYLITAVTVIVLLVYVLVTVFNDR